MAKTATPETKILLMDCQGGKKRRVTVPNAYKVTFGPIIPNERGNHGGNALRIYESKERQVAVFTDVIAFREEALKVEELVTKTESRRMGKNAPGADRDAVMEVKITEWRDPDNPEKYQKADRDFVRLASAEPKDIFE